MIETKSALNWDRSTMTGKFEFSLHVSSPLVAFTYNINISRSRAIGQILYRCSRFTFLNKYTNMRVQPCTHPELRYGIYYIIVLYAQVFPFSHLIYMVEKTIYNYTHISVIESDLVFQLRKFNLVHHTAVGVLSTDDTNPALYTITILRTMFN